MKNFLKNLNLKLSKVIGNPDHSMPLEGILRDPLEFFSAILALSFCLFFLIFNAGLPSGFKYSIAILFFVIFVKRFYQGLYIYLYQKYINKNPTFKITVQDLYKHIENRGPKEKVYIGKGFRWTPQHTQRYYDLESIQEFSKYVNRDTPDPLGGLYHIHGVDLMNEEDIFIERDDRVGHMLLLGATRVGKSRLLELFIEQDIAAGKCVFIIDPKGDKDLIKRVILAAIRAGRLGDLMILHLGFTKESIKYNPIKTFQKISEVATRIASKLPGDGDSAAFAMFAWRFLYIAACAMDAIGEEINIKRIKKHIKSFDGLLVRYTQKFLRFDDQTFKEKVLDREIDRAFLPRHLQDKSDDTINSILYLQERQASDKDFELDDILEDIISAYSYDKSYYDKITASLLPFLDQLDTLSEITSSSDNANELILKDAIANKRIVFLGLDGLSDNAIASSFGSMFFADLVSTTGAEYKTREKFNDVIVHADEFNDVIGDDFIPLLNKAGGAGIQVVAYTQTDHDIKLGFKGSDVKALVAKGNFRTLGMMRVSNKETAEFFNQRLPNVNVKYTTFGTNMHDSDSSLRGTGATSADSIDQKEVPLIQNNTIMSQPVGQIFLSKNGNHIYHARLPLIDEDLTKTVGSIAGGKLGQNIQDVNLKRFKLKQSDVIHSSSESLANVGNLHKEQDHV
jgi:conjugative coupling factor TraD (SXT/TOL subfamily)